MTFLYVLKLNLLLSQEYRLLSSFSFTKKSQLYYEFEQLLMAKFIFTFHLYKKNVSLKNEI